MASSSKTLGATLTAASPATAADAAGRAPVRSLSGLLPFLRPYRGRIALAGLFLLMAALSTLVVPLALRSLIDQGFVAADPGERVMALREHFLALFGVGAALGLFSALRFYMVSWLGERVTADLRNAVYAHVLRQSPAFFETTQTQTIVCSGRAGACGTVMRRRRGKRITRPKSIRRHP